MYLAIDPGGKFNGWAEFTEDGKDDGMGVAEHKEGIYAILRMTSAKIIIVEDFELYPHKSQEQLWSQFHTVRVIGAIEYWAYLTKRKLIFQKPTIKNIAYRWVGWNNKHKHDEDAYVHGYYYLVTNKIINPIERLTKNEG